MKNRFERSSDDELESLRQKVSGLGENSGRKSYYPELRRRIADLEKFRALVDRSTDFVLVVNPLGCVIEDANETICSHLGYTRDEVLNMKVCDVIEGWCMPDFAQERTTSAQLLAKNGQATPIEFTLSTVELSSGRLNMIIARDMTERNRIESELHAAKERAEAANRSKSEFLANMSHEIRTPLNAVLGFTELLGVTEMNEEQQHFVEMISKSGASLLNLLNDILDLSKIEAGRMKLEKSPIQLRDLLEETFEIMARAAKAKGLQASCKVDPALSKSVLADPHRIRQIVTNLLSNAVKFTSHGQVTLRARLESDSVDPLNVVIEIADTGVGIPTDRASDIFGRFTQVDASVTRRFGGSGLGLCITNQLITMMNGTIDLESQVGVGSVFRCRLPLKPISQLPAVLNDHVKPAAAASIAQAPRQEYQRPPSTRSDDFAAQRARARILIAEDSPDNQTLLKAFLKGQPHALTFVSDGQSAVEAFQNEKFDLVLMDMEMPILDGYSATRAIRVWERDHGLAATPIIAQTAHAITEKVHETLTAGCNHHLAKPISKSKLIETISSELERSHLARMEQPIASVAAMSTTEE